MTALAGPFEILELAAGESRTFTVLAAQQGEMDIQPRDGRPMKTIQALRLTVPEADKPTFPYYWDVTSATLVAQLAPMVAYAGYKPRRFTVTKVGSGPQARFTVAAGQVVMA